MKNKCFERLKMIIFAFICKFSRKQAFKSVWVKSLSMGLFSKMVLNLSFGHNRLFWAFQSSTFWSFVNFWVTQLKKKKPSKLLKSKLCHCEHLRKWFWNFEVFGVALFVFFFVFANFLVKMLKSFFEKGRQSLQMNECYECFKKCFFGFFTHFWPKKLNSFFWK